MRVAHLLPYPGVGGTETCTLRVAQALETQGVENFFFCCSEAAPVLEYFRELGEHVELWHRRSLETHGRADFALRTAQLAWTLRRHRVQVIHCADVAAVSRQVTAAARLTGIPLVSHVRNRVEWLSPEIRWALPGVDHVAFVSRATWQVFGEPVSTERASVLYDGVPVTDPITQADRASAGRAVQAELGWPAETQVVGMVARVEPQKDFATLARAARRVLDELPGTRFLIVGGYDRTDAQRAHYPEVQQWLQEAGVAHAVHFAGFRTDTARLLRAMDVAVLSTHWEGVPQVIWEAMREATPLVATAVDGIPEAVRHGDTGLLVPHADAEALAEQLLLLLRDPARAREIGEAGARHLRSTFEPSRFGASLIEVYERAKAVRAARRWRR